MNKGEIVELLRLKGMRVVGGRRNLIEVDSPSQDLKQNAIAIVERFNGKQRHFASTHFNGFHICWNEG